jgi:hypothetical protein
MDFSLFVSVMNEREIKNAEFWSFLVMNENEYFDVRIKSLHKYLSLKIRIKHRHVYSLQRQQNIRIKYVAVRYRPIKLLLDVSQNMI